MRWSPRWIAAALMLVVSVAAQEWTFEQDGEDALAGWSLPVAGSEFAVVADGDDDGDGGHCARLGRGPGQAAIRNAMRSVDATPHRRKLVTLRARLRAGRDARAQMWLRVDRPDEQVGFFDNMQQRPVTSGDFREVEIRGYVADDATRIAFGVMLIAGDELWFDDVALSFTAADERQRPQPPRALEGRALQNVTAFARLLGLVRWFHPSEAVAEVDWHAFAIDGFVDVEQAADAASLAAELQARFAAIAPTLRVVVRDEGEGPALAPPDDAAGALQCVAWVHDGVRLDSRGVYRSERRFAPLGDRGELPDPARPLRVDLPGGVTCWLPVALYAVGDRALPPAAAPEVPWRPRHGAQDRATRLAAVAWTWNVFQHFYPYFDVVDVDWSAELSRALAVAASDADEYALHTTLERLVAATGDGHGQVRLQGDQRFARPPFAVRLIEGALVVTAVAAAAVGVEVGDVLVAIDGEPALEVFAERCRRQAAATDGWRHVRAAQALLYGEPGTELVVRLRGADGAERDATFARGTAPVPEPPRPAPIAEVAPGVRYVDVGRVTDDDFDAALAQLVAARAVVFDFRGYPRQLSARKLFAHLLAGPAQSPRWCVPHVLLPDRDGMQCPELGRWNLQPAAPRIAGKLVFVTDGRAISYAESCLAIIAHEQLGAIVGERTAGTNGNVNPFEVPGGFTVSWTGMQVRRHDDGVHHGIGIAPTVPCSPTIAGVRAGRDELLERALEVAGDGG